MNLNFLSAIAFVLAILIGTSASAIDGLLLRGETLSPATWADIVSEVEPGTVVIIGEIHDSLPHHENQKELLQALASRLNKISVGMEFFEFQHQITVDNYTSGKIGEVEFLKTIGWQSPTFDLYREQVLFPRSHQGSTRALNASRKLTSAIARKGINGLSPELAALIPIGFKLGNQNYYERFAATMHGHVSASDLLRYFEAQSVWDDTMALVAAQYVAAYPDQVLVIIVGNFHVEYGGGLPDRLLKRGAQKVLTIGQVSQGSESLNVLLKSLKPDPRHGKFADYILITD
ncbi:MAG: ChaN family lipoprotein [Oligoflexia bacterium]|nr:ChaN family lipoprotein [Oligoflexia bacterium]